MTTNKIGDKTEVPYVSNKREKHANNVTSLKIDNTKQYLTANRGHTHQCAYTQKLMEEESTTRKEFSQKLWFTAIGLKEPRH